MSKKNKKSHAGLIVILVILVLAVAGGTAFYLYQRQQPKKTAEQFLDSMQKMDFTTMESLLQSSDLSALDNADIRNAAYTDFFTAINQKMTYKITGNRFDIQNGTASVTAHITYVDGTNIYKETITEFLRQIVASAYSGAQLSEEETQEKLASILNEKAKSSEKDEFSEADIIYPLIKTNEGWKIVSLDDTTVKVMCANFKSVKDEISSQLTDDSTDSSSAAAEDSSTPGSTASAEGTSASIDITTDKFSVRFKQFAISKDYGGNPCLMIYYDYTNSGDSQSSAFVDFTLQASQNGEVLEGTYPEASDDAVDNYMSTIDPGKTVTVCQVFLLKDTTSDVTLQGKETLNVSGGQTTSQILKLK